MTQLGGHAHFIDSETSQIAHGESPKDMGTILSTYGHGIMIRHDLVPGEGQSYMREVAQHASIPVINMQCDVDHPCQTLADLMTIREEFGKDLKDLKIAVSWAYAPSYVKPMSVPQGLIMLMTRFGMNVTLAHPPEYTLMDEPMQLAHDNAARSGGQFRGRRQYGRRIRRCRHRLSQELGRGSRCSASRRRRCKWHNSTVTGFATKR